ncbi:MAG: glycosyltransferase [Acidobacteriota bacterium]|nr:glycosyltransferase [Acidobacteriota bacterium]
MTAAAGILAAVAALLLVWSYAAYPALVSRLARRVTPGGESADAQVVEPPSVEVLIAAFDEEDVIRRRVENALAQSHAGALTVSIGCDGCRDRTADRARESGDGRVRVEEFPVRRGKAAVLNDLVAAARADVLVFTDANSTFADGAIARLADRFADPKVGAACGRLVLEPAAGSEATPETEFWDRETRVKEAEGKLGVCLGGNGAIYAARRRLVRPLPAGTALDDFLIPARIAAEGWSVVFEPDAVARESTAPDVAAEARRRLRIGIGAGGLLRRERWLFDFRARPLLALAFVSRKAARWLAPVLGLLAVAAGLASPVLRPFAAAVAVLVVLAVASIPLHLRLTGWPGRLYYFLVMNLALAVGIVAGLAGHRRPVWDRTAREA